MPIHLTPISFNDCLNTANQYVKEGGIPSKKHLMLGNGFSIAFRSDIFRYKALADRVQSQHVKNIFANLGTSDFEYVMRRLTDALKVVNLYPNNTTIANQIRKDLDELRNSLIQAISESHPENPSSISESQYRFCHSFLVHFDDGNKYTFNYDLLLYWVYMQFMYSKDKPLKIGDGFGTDPNNSSILTWDISRENQQSIYYLHGAMHLFNDSGIIQKIKWVDNDVSIREQVCYSITAAKYPMFISEGTKEHKRSRIQSSSYLDHAFRSLDDISDNLFIFGHSLGDEDDHVFNRVNSQSDLRNIFISIHGDVNSGDNQRIVNKVSGWERLNSNKHYYFYDAVSANVWGTP